jgi:hypothetical protein
MSILYGFSIALNFITAGTIWYVKIRCEKESFIQRKLNAFIQALLYDGE